MNFEELSWVQLQGLPGLHELALFQRVCALLQGPEQMNLDEAARTLRIQKSFLSKKMRDIATKILGGRDPSPGEVFIDCARGKDATVTRKGARLAADIDLLLQRFGVLAKQAGLRRLSIGATNAVISYILPFVLKTYLQKHPDIAIDVSEGQPDEVMRYVRHGRVDIGMGPFITAKECDPAPVLTMKRGVFCAPEDPLSRKKGRKVVSVLKDLASRTVLTLREDCVEEMDAGQRITALLPSPIAPSGRRIVLPNIGQIRSWVQVGIGVAVGTDLNPFAEKLGQPTLPTLHVGDYFGCTKLHYYFRQGSGTPGTIPAEFVKICTAALRREFPELVRRR